jgi:hypothetical protein
MPAAILYVYINNLQNGTKITTIEKSKADIAIKSFLLLSFFATAIPIKIVAPKISERK